MFPIFSQSSEYLYDCKTCYYCYYKKEAAKKSPQEGTQAYVVCPIFAANYKRSWLKKNLDLAKQNEHFDCRQTQRRFSRSHLDL